MVEITGAFAKLIDRLPDPKGAPPPSKDHLDEVIGSAVASSSHAFGVHRGSSLGGAKDIDAAIWEHTDKCSYPHEVNYTAVVNDVFSELNPGDCLPPEIQALREELQTAIDNGHSPYAEDAAKDLAYLDELIVLTAKQLEADPEVGAEPITFNENLRTKSLETLASLLEPPGANTETSNAQWSLYSTLRALDTESLSPEQMAEINAMVEQFVQQAQDSGPPSAQQLKQFQFDILEVAHEGSSQPIEAALELKYLVRDLMLESAELGGGSADAVAGMKSRISELTGQPVEKLFTPDQLKLLNDAVDGLTAELRKGDAADPAVIARLTAQIEGVAFTAEIPE